MRQVVGVCFNSSNKVYRYFWPEGHIFPEIGEMITVNSMGREAMVKVMTFDLGQPGEIWASKSLSIVKRHGIRKFNRPNKRNNKMKDIMNNTKESLTEAKNTAIKFQAGTAVIAAIKTTICETDKVPDSVKALMDSDYSDIAIGLLMDIAAKQFTDNKKVQYAANAAQFVGSVKLSNEFSLLENLVTTVVTGALAKIQTPNQEVKDA